jgi:predicted transcriptional regulator
MQDQYIHMAANIVTANATGRGLSTDQIIDMLKSVAATLESLSTTPTTEVLQAELTPEEKPSLTWQESIGRNSITCLLCGFQGTTLNAHIRRKHHLSSKEYCAQYGIPRKTPLVSKAYSAKRSKMAKESGLGLKLQEARQAKRATTAEEQPKTAKKSKKETAVI